MSVWDSDHKVMRVFPRRTSYTPNDRLTFVGYPPLTEFRPSRNEGIDVHVSVCFTWDLPLAYRLRDAWNEYYFPCVKIGGPALASPVHKSMPGLYVKPEVLFFSRGCNNNCPWCLVPMREGPLREMEPTIPAIRQNPIVQDNNLLQCSKEYLDKVFRMLTFCRGITFAGGLDSRLINDRVADRIRGLHIKQLFLSCDTRASIRPLRKAVNKLRHLNRNQLRCYVLIGYDDKSISGATERLEEVWEAGCMPFAQLYQPPDRHIDYPQEWKDLNRTWERPAAMAALHKNSKGG